MKLFRFALASIVFFHLGLPAEAQEAAPPPVTVSGKLVEKGTKKPLAHVNIYAFSPQESVTPTKVETDAFGAFSVTIAPGTLRWKIAVANYEVYDRLDKLEATADAQSRTFYLEKKSYLVYETTVFGQGEKRDDKTKTLTQDQFMTLPGSNGDPVRAVQNLPGVNRGSAFSAQVIIEGSAPNDTKYNIDTQPVPIIFHFSGLSSVVLPEAVDRVDYLSAGFGPEYGQSIAGLVNLYTKAPQTDRTHGMGYVDIFNMGGLVEGPVNDHSSYLIGARKSYVGQVLGAVAKGNSNFNLTVAPDFNDMVMIYANTLNSKDSLKIVTVGSIDTFAFVLPEPIDQEPSLRGDFNLSTSFYRVIPEYTHKASEATTDRLWLGLGQDSTKQQFGQFYNNSAASVVSGRGEIESQMEKRWKTYVGVENVATWTKNSFQVPFVEQSQGGTRSPLSSATTQTASQNYFLDAAAVYWRNVIHDEDSRWTYLPGVRVGYYNQTKEFLPEPRFALRYALPHGLTLRGATGLYDEAPTPQNLDPTFGNPDLKAQNAIHGTIGAEKDFRDGASAGWVVSSDLFYKHLYHLVENSSQLNAAGRPEYYNNKGTGKVFGAEFLVKYQSKKWSGWVAYTLSRSNRTYPPASEQIFQYDQTHNLILIGEREFGKNWKFSGRFRLTSGDPYTPITGGTYDVDNDVYLPTSGGTYSQRLEPFYQLDFRFDKKWIFESWILTGYLDIENATNHANVQQINYSYNYQQRATITGLPLLPTLGIKGEF